MVIPITSNDIEIELEAGAVLENTSASGVDFFQFAGTAGTRNRVNFRGGRILSGVSAGHVFTFAPGVGLGFADWTSEIAQLNPAKSILIWTGVSGSGLFTNRFGGPNWEHGSVSTPPSVPAVDINNDANPEDVVDTDRFNVFNDNTFAMQRCTCHFGTKPFFSFINDGPSVGAFYSHNSVSIRTIERARRGFIKIAGALGFVARDCAFYDSYYVDGHLIETTAGKRGRACEQCHFEDIEVVSVSGGVVGVADTHKPVTSLTLSGFTPTTTALSISGICKVRPSVRRKPQEELVARQPRWRNMWTHARARRTSARLKTVGRDFTRVGLTRPTVVPLEGLLREELDPAEGDGAGHPGPA